MNRSPDSLTDTAAPVGEALAQRAEAIAQARAARPSVVLADPSPEFLHQSIHTLQVQQIELELQNEELRQSQAQRNAAEARYFDFYELAPVGYITVGNDDQMLQANLTTATLLGMTRSKLLWRTVIHFIHLDDQHSYHLQCQRTRTTGTSQSCELRMRRHDGTVFWGQLQFVAAKLEDGSAVLRMVLSDISERKILEQRLVQDEAKLRAILDGASDAIFITNRTGHYQYVNQQATQLLGFDRHELLSMSFHDITSTEDLPEVLSLFKQLLAAGNKRFELSLKRRDGSLVSVELSGAVLADGSVFGACRDITERKQLLAMQLERAIQDEVATSRQRLRELVALNEAALEEERKHIAREVHDELGQVLTALRMDLSLLDMRYGRLDTELGKDVLGMKTTVDRAIQGVRNVATHLRPTALDMGLVPAIDWLCQEFVRLTGMPCHLDASNNVELDKTRAVVVFRIVQESLTNISRYASANQVHVVLRQHGDDLTLQVSDNGQGFDMGRAEQKKTFGLLGMRERAIALGGRLKITSSPGHGAILDLSIPVTSGVAEVPA
jgi:PAS domain S-box-containing protein